MWKLLVVKLIDTVSGWLNGGERAVHPVLFTPPQKPGMSWRAHYRGWTAYGDTPKEAEKAVRKIGDKAPL